MIGTTIDHVGMVVPSIDAVRPTLERLLGVAAGAAAEVPALGLTIAFVGSVELMQPHGPDSLVGRFLAAHGAALHHVAFRVPDLDAALAELTAGGVELVDKEPRMGAGGHRIAFLHPKSTAGFLIELIERTSPSTPEAHR